MPLPNTRMIHRQWSFNNAKHVPTSMNASVTIGSADGPPVYVDDDVTQGYTQTFAGEARIQQQKLVRTGDVGGEALSGRGYLVQIPISAPEVSIGMRVKVTASTNDPDMVGQDLWVVDVQFGSERFNRDLACSDNLTDVPSAA